MTRQEFTNRTEVEVTFDEFTAIHIVYMASDMDKDDFCALWKKMNKSRVDEARKANKIAKQNEIDLTKPKNKKIENYYWNGQLRERYTIDEWGFRIGKYEAWFPDGQLEKRYIYKNGHIA